MIWLLGSTGLTGKFVADLIEDDSDFDSNSVIAPVRKSSKTYSKINQIEFDFASEKAISDLPKPDSVICCIGTTIKKAGSESAFKAIDFELVMRFAHQAKSMGCKQFILISSIGANHKSSIFYLKVKGELEEELAKLNFESTLFLRPAALFGNRKEKRFGERIGIKFSQFISPILIGFLRNYRPINAFDVAKVIVNNAKHPLIGFHIFESSKIQKIAESLFYVCKN